MKHRALWLGMGWAFVVLVIYLSLNPDPIDAGRVEGVKVGHFIAYGWLMLWFAATPSLVWAWGLRWDRRCWGVLAAVERKFGKLRFRSPA